MAQSDRMTHAGQAMELALWALRRMPCRDHLQTEHWRRLRALTLRFGQACARCPARERLGVHHRSYARRGFEQPEDLVVLCAACHRRHHGTLAVRTVRAMAHRPLRLPFTWSPPMRLRKGA